MLAKETMGLGAQGRWRDQLVYADGRIVMTPWRHNQIQNLASTIAASLFRRFDEVSPGNVPPVFEGIKYMAVGRGDVSWDALPIGSIPQPVAQATLEDEFFRKEIQPTEMSFLDPDDPAYPVIAGPSRMIQVEVTLTSSEANDTHREFGLFCGQTAGALDSGLIMNWIAHRRIDKDTTLTINRTVQILFALP